jgi:hypothetical protein
MFPELREEEVEYVAREVANWGREG